MPEEKKIGTKVTYTDPDGNNKPVEVLGVPLAPGKTVDLADFVDEKEAQRVAEKLAGNPYFRVEGGPDHKGVREKREQRLIEQEEAVQEAFRRNQAKRQPADTSEPEAPESYAAPESNTLESNAARTAPADLPPQPRSSRSSR